MCGSSQGGFKKRAAGGSRKTWAGIGIMCGRQRDAWIGWRQAGGEDWNFVVSGESRERALATTGSENDILNSLFDELFEEYAELHQHEQTRGR